MPGLYYSESMQYSKIYPYVILSAMIVLYINIPFLFYTGNTDADYAMRNFHTFSVIGDMALGGMMAYYCSYESRFLGFIHPRKMPRWQIVLPLMVYLDYCSFFAKQIDFCFAVFNGDRTTLTLATLFALIIAEQNYATRSFFKFSRFQDD